MNRGSPLLLLVTLVLGACPGFAQTFEPVDAVVVVDANGKVVGKVFEGEYGTDIHVEVAFRVLPNNIVFKLRIDNNGFIDVGQQVGPQYTTTDCSGTPYLGGSTRSPFPASVINNGPHGLTIWVADVNAAPRQVTTVAYTGSQPCARLTSPQNLFWFPAIAINVDSMFTPPFHLASSTSTSAAACCGDCNGNGTVTIDEILTSVNNALNGCPQ